MTHTKNKQSMTLTIIAASVRLGIGASVLTMPAAAHAQEAPKPAKPVTMQRVAVTGTLIKRLDAETSLPVQVITR